jgi:S1-C subfamily serine protease
LKIVGDYPVRPQNLKVAKRPFTDLSLADQVFAIGYPHGFRMSVSRGIVSAKYEEKGLKYFQTDASINKGNSGGPLLNDKGELLAINISFASIGGGSEGLSMALAAESFLPFLKVFDLVDDQLASIKPEPEQNIRRVRNSRIEPAEVVLAKTKSQ